jgi:hypothetical protein
VEHHVEGGEADERGVGLAEVVDLAAVDDDEVRAADRLAQGVGGAGDDLVEGDPRAARALDAGEHRPLAGLGVVDSVLAGMEALDLAAVEGRAQAAAGASHGGEDVHADLGDGRQFGEAGAQVGGGRGAGVEAGEQLFGHLKAQRVDHEQRGRAWLLGT